MFILFFRLETRPPIPTSTDTEPKSSVNGEWRSATLKPATAIVHQPTTTVAAPVPPPRKKRNSLLKDGRPGGFKDVFGNFTRRSSCDSALSFDRTAISDPKRRNSSTDIHSDEFCDFSKDLPERSGLKRKISKVGNKKSDKFFGENLSDCLSDEPVSASTPIVTKKEVASTKDELDAFVENNLPKRELKIEKINLHENNVLKKINDTHQTSLENHVTATQPENDDVNASLDKKAEFLMAMLEDYGNEEMKYHNKEAISEPMIVPKRKQGRHICDDDEKLKRIFQKNEKKAEEKSHDVIDAPKKVATAQAFQQSDHKLIEARLEAQLEAQIEEKAKQRLQMANNIEKRVHISPDMYDQMKPVEEPIIVPKRVVRKHICDDDDKMHLQFDKTVEKKDILDAVRTSPDVTASPKKPDRDFSRYRKSVDLSINSNERVALATHVSNIVERPTRKKEKKITRESLPTPPPRPITTNYYDLPRKSVVQTLITSNNAGIINHKSLGAPAPLNPIKQSVSHNDTNKLESDYMKLSAAAIQNELMGNEKLDAILKKCNSSQSFLTPDLMDQIVNKVYGFKMSWDDHDNVHHGGYDDGSGQVAPSSKLKTRKISTIKNQHNMEKAIIEEATEDGKRPTFSIGDKTISNIADEKKIEKPISKVKSSDKIISISNELNGKSLEESVKAEVHKIKKPVSDIKSSDKVIPILNELNGKSLEESVKAEVHKITTDASKIVTDRIPTINIDTKTENHSFEAVNNDLLNDSTLSSSSTNDSLTDRMIKRTDTILELKPNLDKSRESIKSSEISLNSSSCGDISNVLEDIYSNSKSILGDFHQFLEDSQLTEKLMTAVKDQEEEARSKNTSESSTEFKLDDVKIHLVTEPAPSSDIEDENDETPMTPPAFFKLSHKNLFNATSGVADEDLPIIPDRRGSIVDHDQWFNKYSGLSESDHAADKPLMRRGSECISYDTRKLFPFGIREKTYSESNDFFDSKTLSKSSDHINNEGDQSVDHSVLLKFMDKEKKSQK